jgi:hypothetical protein
MGSLGRCHNFVERFSSLSDFELAVEDRNCRSEASARHDETLQRRLEFRAGRFSWRLCAISEVQDSVANLDQKLLPEIAGHGYHVWGCVADPLFVDIIRHVVPRKLRWDCPA